MNIAFLSGYVSKVENIQTKDNKTGYIITLPTNEYYNNTSKTEWHTLRAFGKIAEIIEKIGVTKGSYINIQGKIKYSTYETQNGSTAKSTSIDIISIESPKPSTKKNEDAKEYNNVQKDELKSNNIEEYDFNDDEDTPF